MDDTVDVSMKAGVKHLFLFHHDPDHDDAHVTRMLEGARAQAKSAGSLMIVDAAKEGVEVYLEPKTAPTPCRRSLNCRATAEMRAGSGFGPMNRPMSQHRTTPRNLGCADAKLVRRFHQGEFWL